MKHLQLLTAILMFPALFAAAKTPSARVGPLGETDETVTKADSTFVKTLSNQKYGQFHIAVRKDGHQNGLPYLIEIRASCGGARAKNWLKVKVSDVKSACGVNTKSFKYDADQMVASMEYFDVDWEEFDARRKANGGNTGSLEPKCKTTPDTAKFSLPEVCALQDK